MNAVQQALIYLARANGQVTSDIIKDLIADHAPKAARMKALYKRYKAEVDGVPIFTRTFEDDNKINNKLNNDFFSDIVDTKVGYFAGEPIAYGLDKTNYTGTDGELNEADYYKHLGVIDKFKIHNNVDDLDAETAKMAAICGYAARLCYIDTDGWERVINIAPWECIFISDRSIGKPVESTVMQMLMLEQKANREKFWIKAIDDVYEHLPDEDKKLVDLKYFEAYLSNSGVARQLNISEREFYRRRERIVWRFANRFGLV